MRRNDTRVLPILLALLCQLVFMRLPVLAEPLVESGSTSAHSFAARSSDSSQWWRIDIKQPHSKCEMATTVWTGAALSASKPAQQAKFSAPIKSIASICCSPLLQSFDYTTLASLTNFNRCSGQPLWLLNCALLR